MAVEARALTGIFAADPDHSSVVFGIRHMNVSMFRASFGGLDARLVGDDSGVTLEGRVPVESISITTPAEFREHVLTGEDFFDARSHPEITFHSSRVELEEEGTARVEGELTIKGVSKAVTAIGLYREPIQDPFGAVRAAIELEATVDRREWGMNWQLPLPGGGEALGYQVELTIHLELVKQD